MYALFIKTMDATTAVAEKSASHSLYYTGDANSLVQAEPVTYDTKLTQQFANMGQGQNAFYIPPGNGIKGVMAVFELSVADLSGVGTGVVLPRAWAYSGLIANTSWRISGSQQYYLQGSQILAKNLAQAKTQSQKDAILSLGGEEWNFANGPPSHNLRAYVPLSFWCSPSNDFLEVPIASDLLGSQIQITLTMNPVSSIFNLAPGGTLGTVPQTLSTGYFQCEQLTLRDRSQSLVNRPDVNLDTQTYTQAIRGFHQQEITIQIPASQQSQSVGNGNVSTVQPVTANGFMAGQVRGILAYLTVNGGSTAKARALNKANANVFYAPDSIEAVFAGQIYASYKNGSSRAWNMIDSSSLPYANTSYYDISGANTTWLPSTPALSEYVYLPFSQPMSSDYEADILVSGLSISNGSVTLNVATPDYTKDWVLHVIPVLNSAIAYSRGSANVLIG